MEQHRPLIEAGAAALVAGSLTNALPATAAVFGICWYGVQIWQSETGKNWRMRWRRLLTRQELTAEDRIAFIVLGLSGAGVFLAMVAIGRLVQ